jgi:hypothetical protein
MITSIDFGLAVIDYVKALPYVDPDRINLYGVSLGGNLVMNLVSRVPVHAAIVGAPAVMWLMGIQMPPPGSPPNPDAFKNLKPHAEISRKTRRRSTRRWTRWRSRSCSWPVSSIKRLKTVCCRYAS